MILFFDIDGTLWDYKNYIPESTKEGIRKAKKNGHKCFINTGRSRSFVSNQELLGMGFDGIVSACGCMIEYDGKTIYNRLMDKDDAIRTVETVRRYGFRPILEGPEHLYMERKDFEGDMYGRKVMADMGDRLRGIDDIYDNHKLLFEKYFKLYRNYLIIDKRNFEIEDSLINKNVFLKESFSYPLREDEIDEISTLIHINNSNDNKVGEIQVKLKNNNIGKVDIYSSHNKKENDNILFKFKKLFVR